MDNSRRDFIRTTTLAAAGTMIAGSLPASIFNINGNPEFELPALPYGADSLEPHVDKMTMEIHHGKHHKAYVDNLNNALKENHIHGTLEEILSKISKHPAAVRNNAGGHYNHSLFWKLMKPNGGGEPKGKLAEAIKSDFGSFEEMKNKFNSSAKDRFGSGWAWLIVNKSGKLEIGSTPNQDNPLMDVCEFKGKPVLALDVWEHAYYLKYQNKRPDYISAWWNVVNWEEATRLYVK